MHEQVVAKHRLQEDGRPPPHLIIHDLEGDGPLVRMLQFLDIGLKTHRTYRIVNPKGGKEMPGQFAINLADVAAITAITAA